MLSDVSTAPEALATVRAGMVSLLHVDDVEVLGAVLAARRPQLDAAQPALPQVRATCHEHVVHRLQAQHNHVSSQRNRTAVNARQSYAHVQLQLL